jgi:hypothetical protein
VPAAVVTIAEAVKDRLNAPPAPLSQSFTAIRAYVPTFGKQDSDADEFAELRVTVVAAELTMATLSRRDDDFDYVVDVAIQKRIDREAIEDADFNAEVDPLMLLAEEVMDLFRGKRLTGYETALCVAAANRPIFAPEHLDEQRLFTSLIRLTFRVARAR